MAEIKCLTENEYWMLVHSVLGVPGDGPVELCPDVDRSCGRNALERKRNVVLLLLMGEAGLRVSEAVGIRWPQLLFTGTVSSLVDVVSAVAKGAQSRRVPMSGLLASAVTHLYDQLVARSCLPLDACVIGRGLDWVGISSRRAQAIIKEAGGGVIGRPLTPHMLRHTFAVRLRRRTDLPTVQALLGHKRLSSTQIYMNCTDDDKVRAIKSLGV